MKKYTITEEDYHFMWDKIQSLENENSRLKGYIKGLKEQLRTLDVVRQSEQSVCPNCDGEGFSGKGTNEILPCLICFGSGEKVN